MQVQTHWVSRRDPPVASADVRSETALAETHGYLHRCYARSLVRFGTPRWLPRSKGWILERAIPGAPWRDAMGCYPLFTCQDWSQLRIDLDEMDSDLVSLALVTDPFGDYDTDELKQCFRDVVIPFKEHYFADLGRPLDEFVCRHHQRNARKALRSLRVERCEYPVEAVDDWTALYGHLIHRHSIAGIAAFSRASFLEQLKVPGLVAFRVRCQDAVVGMGLFYVQGDVSYWHLAAYNPLGYRLRASFALAWTAIEHLGDSGVRSLVLGAGAGIKPAETDGLTRFKRGWATGSRTAYFCGRIYDPTVYSELAKAHCPSGMDYFPAYRDGEFA